MDVRVIFYFPVWVVMIKGAVNTFHVSFANMALLFTVGRLYLVLDLWGQRVDTCLVSKKFLKELAKEVEWPHNSARALLPPQHCSLQPR